MRQMNRLSAIAVAQQSKPGRFHDGGGLYLQVSKSQTKSWVYRYMLDGRQREMGLGPYPEFSLADARARTMDYRKLACDGIDPIAARHAAKQKAKLDAARSVTFAEAARSYHKVHRHRWRNEKHSKQWLRTLELYAFPAMGSRSVQDIDRNIVLSVLEPIWNTKTETADRVRQRIEVVLNWAKARGLRDGDNPAQWRGHLNTLLGAGPKSDGHFTALPVEEIGNFVQNLRQHGCMAATALEFLILTAARTNEVLGARWDEIGLVSGVWTVPAGRMKAAKEHRVPLSNAALALLKPLSEARVSDLVFPGAKQSRPLSNMAMLKLLARMDCPVTVHGFRSTFSDWAAERTAYPREVVEMALAHTIANKVEAAYRRGDLFMKRKALMEDWAKYCNSPRQVSTVVQFVPDSALERAS